MLESSAPAKLNFGLHVLRRRVDGYHDLDTIFVRIAWCDHLRVEPADGLTMTCSDPSLPVDDTNLCMQAGLLLREVAGGSHGARIHLDKAIPHGAGLGGGSSDAATTLRLLDRLWGVGLDDTRRMDLALRIGSDVPFFLGPAVARGTSRGERLHPIGTPYGLSIAEIVVAVPPVRISTARAFQMVEPRVGERTDLETAFAVQTPAEWKDRLVNDFQDPIAAAEPLVRRALDALVEHGADYSSLTGSGSAVFGCFTRHEHAVQAELSLEAIGCRTWRGRAGDPVGD